MRAETTAEAWRSVAARGSTLAERLAGVTTPSPRPGAAEAVTTRLTRWAAVVGGEEQCAVRRREVGLDDADVHAALGPVAWPDGAPLPSWVLLLEEVAAWAAVGGDLAGRPRTGRERLPFDDLLAPFVHTARDRLAAVSGDAYRLLSRNAHDDLERGLLRRLTYLSVHALHLEFRLARLDGSSGLDRLLARVGDPHRRIAYEAFVTGHRRNLLGLFATYPVLARLMALATEQWVRTTQELLDRFAVDREAIAERFGRPVGRVLAAEPGLSDPHHGGREVVGLHVGSGLHLLYKPKDLGTEAAFGELLQECADLGASLSFRTVRLLPRAGYGWVEWVPRRGCASPAEVRRFYRRAGMLLAVVHAVRGTDCHHDNVVACGEHPVLVDAECLLHPDAEPAAGTSTAWETAREQLGQSVLATGMLPNWEIRDDGAGGERAWDISALHTPEAGELRATARRWVRTNTDHMAQEDVERLVELPSSQPLLNGRPARLQEHATELLEGFTEMAGVLSRHADRLLRSTGPIHALARHQVRFVWRNTRSYGALHDRLRDPAFLRDGADRAIELEALARTLPREGAPGPRTAAAGRRRLVRSEQCQMEQLDIPLFHACPTGTTVSSAGRPLGPLLREPSLEAVHRRLRRLDETEVQRQLGYVAGSLYGHTARTSVTVSGPPVAWPAATSAHAGTAVDRVAVATELAEQIAARALRGTDGSAAWIAPEYLPAVDRFQYQPVSADLNTGTCGIALFLAVLQDRTGDGRFHELALGALHEVRRPLADATSARELAGVLGLGGATGMGAVVYALTRIADHLQAPELLADARTAAACIDEALDIAPPDVFLGAAGAALGLLALHRATGDPGLLDCAARCGERVLAARTFTATGHRAWTTVRGRALTGFSHGAAGIAYALCRLAEVTGRDDFLAAAEEAVAYEGAVFVTAVGNWPDLRQEQPAFALSWCHGAPGIGLARLGGLGALASEAVLDDVRRAVQAVLEGGSAGPDHLCCGSLGRGDLLVTAAERCGRPDLLEHARQLADQSVRRARSAGGFVVQEMLPVALMPPGLLQGAAGIGYQLLRLDDPSAVPSVLLWDG